MELQHKIKNQIISVTNKFILLVTDNAVFSRCPVLI